MTTKTDKEIPFLDLNEATREQVNAVFDTVQASLHKTLKKEQDFEVMISIASKTNAHIPKEAVSLIRAMQRIMAKQIGYTPRAMQLLCIKHGLSVLDPKKLKMVLVNKQRMTPQVRAWCRAQHKIEVAERLSNQRDDELVEDHEADDDEPVEDHEAEGRAWAAKWQNATDEEIEAEFERQSEIFAR